MQALAALIPSIGVGFVFYIAIKAMIGADRNERAALAELDRAEAARPAERTDRVNGRELPAEPNQSGPGPSA